MGRTIQVDKQTSRRVPAKLQRGALALPARHDTSRASRSTRSHLAPLRAGERVARQRPKFRSTHAGLAGSCVRCANVALSPFPYPTKPVQFDGRAVGVVVTPPLAVEPGPMWQDSPGRDAAVAVVVREGRCSARSSSSSRCRRLADSSLLPFLLLLLLLLVPPPVTSAPLWLYCSRVPRTMLPCGRQRQH